MSDIYLGRTKRQAQQTLHRAIRRSLRADDPHIVELSDLAAESIYYFLTGQVNDLKKECPDA